MSAAVVEAFATIRAQRVFYLLTAPLSPNYILHMGEFAE
jgi:hypothetical protein